MWFSVISELAILLISGVCFEALLFFDEELAVRFWNCVIRVLHIVSCLTVEFELAGLVNLFAREALYLLSFLAHVIVVVRWMQVGWGGLTCIKHRYLRSGLLQSGGLLTWTRWHSVYTFFLWSVGLLIRCDELVTLDWRFGVLFVGYVFGPKFINHKWLHRFLIRSHHIPVISCVDILWEFVFE